MPFLVEKKYDSKGGNKGYGETLPEGRTGIESKNKQFIPFRISGLLGSVTAAGIFPFFD